MLGDRKSKPDRVGSSPETGHVSIVIVRNVFANCVPNANSRNSRVALGLCVSLDEVYQSSRNWLIDTLSSCPRSILHRNTRT
jgi:hypothetical protein